MASTVESLQVGVFLFVIISTFLDYSWADDDDEEMPDCPDHDGGEKSSFSFTNEVMIVILVTAVATLIVSSVGFLLCMCFCTCRCSVEEKVAKVPAPRPAKHEGGQAANSFRSREQIPTTGPSKTRFVIKIPGLGNFPIYGQVEPLSNASCTPSPSKGNDSSSDKTRRKAGHANGALSPETDDELNYDGNGDLGDGVTAGRSVRPPPPNLPSSLQPKPPTVSSKEFLQMQLEMSRIRANTYQCRNQVRQINDGEVYRFENVQSY